MPPAVSTVTVCEPSWAPGRFVLIRVDAQDSRRQYAWCGRSMGWRPLKTTSNAYFHLFPSVKKGMKAADKYTKLSVQEES